MEVDKLGDFVLAQVIASFVGQRGDSLSGLPHLEGGEGGVLVEGSKPCLTLLTTDVQYIQRVALSTHPVRKDVQTVSQDLGMLLQLLDFVRYAALSRLRQGRG